MQHSARGHGTHQDLVEDAVVGALEHRDLVATGHGAGHAEGGGDGLRAGVTEGRPFHARELADERRHLAGERRLRPDLESAGELRCDGLDDEIGRVPEQDRPEAAGIVDVLVTVHVPQPRPYGALGDDRVDDFLPHFAESGCRARVGELRTARLGELFRSRGPRRVPPDQRVESSLLLRRQLVDWRPLRGAVRPERLLLGRGGGGGEGRQRLASRSRRRYILVS